MNKITNKKETRDLFQMELTQLEKDDSFLLEKLKMARLDGDFKENADWLLIEEKISANRQKIISLKNKIAKLEQNNNVSKFIAYRLLATGEEKLIELTDYWEADPTKNKVYYNSPLGIALTKKKIKEISEVQTQHGNYKVQIIDIK